MYEKKYETKKSFQTRKATFINGLADLIIFLSLDSIVSSLS